jgi:hypothetical protein
MQRPTLQQFIPRRPRHDTVAPDGLPIAIRVGDDDSRDGHLKNLSREGFQVVSPQSFALGQEIGVHLSDPTSGHEFTFHGTVRWATDDGDGHFTIGCQSTQTADWATLGELFLRRMLDRH